MMHNKEKVKASLRYLNSNYTKVGHPLYGCGITKIYNFFNGNLPIPAIEHFLSKKNLYTLHRQPKKFRRNPSFFYNKRQQFQCDLIEISKIKRFNNGYCYILTVIDVWTRKAFCRLLKRKTADEVLKALKEIFEEAKILPKTILFDRGSELKNKKMNNFLQSLGIKVFYSDNFVHAPFVERFNYSIQVLIYKYLTDNNTYTFHNKLSEILNVYNGRIHRFLQMTPNDAENDVNRREVLKRHEEYYNKWKKRKPKYKVGTKVRISKQKNKFSRGYEKTFQSEIFQIVNVHTRLPIPLYTLKSLERNDMLEGKFYESEIFPYRN